MKVASVVFALVLASFATLSAQATPIRLNFELLKNGKVVAQPTAQVAASTSGTVTVEGVGKFEFTPKMRDADHIAIAFDVQSAGKQFKPRVVLGSEPASLSWSAKDSTDSFELRISWAK